MTKILVIEDEEAVRDIISEMLIAENFDVVCAENGEIGVQLAQVNSPDLIICDIMMPTLDGYGVLTTLRKNITIATIPFIFVTAKASRLDLREGMQLGADDYLTKPFTRDELLGAVMARLGKQRTIIRQYTAERQQYREIEKEVKNLQRFNENREEIFKKFSEDLRQSISKINMAVHMLKNTPQGLQGERYLEILQAECEQEITLLNQVAELHSLLTPENLSILRQYNLLRG